MAVTSAEPRTWNALVSGLGLPDLKDSVHRWEDPAAVAGQLAEALRVRRAERWVAELGPLGGSIVRVNRGPELQDDPQVRARGVIQQVGDVLVPRSPVRIRHRSGVERPAAATFWPPSVGTDTRAVLAGAGLDDAAIDELRAAGVIGEAGPAYG